MKIEGQTRTYALVSLYSTPDIPMLNLSNGVVILCKYLGDEALRVIPVTCIKVVVGMIPYSGRQHNNIPQDISGNNFFVAERLGLVGSDLQDFDLIELHDQ